MIFLLATLQRADVYSFGIIAHEVIYGKGCFWLGPETPNPNIETLGKSRRAFIWQASLVENVRSDQLDVNGNPPRPFIPIDQNEHIRLCNIQVLHDYSFFLISVAAELDEPVQEQCGDGKHDRDLLGAEPARASRT
jgi:hypothetical protein